MFASDGEVFQEREGKDLGTANSIISIALARDEADSGRCHTCIAMGLQWAASCSEISPVLLCELLPNGRHEFIVVAQVD
jgi:hypothetical protein